MVPPATGREVPEMSAHLFLLLPIVLILEVKVWIRFEKVQGDGPDHPDRCPTLP